VRAGSRKSTRLSRLRGLPASLPAGSLDQRRAVLRADRTVLGNVRAAARSAAPNEVRAPLARFLLRGPQVDRPAGALSGGERLRATLACLLLADPAPQLLLLDEPTNNLDLPAVTQLTSALSSYRGAMIVVSHDERFLRDIGVERTWSMHRGALTTA